MPIETGAATSTREKPLVLHVAEALGGGLMVAVRDYIESTKDDVDHVVLGARRDGHDTGDFEDVPVLELGSLKRPIRVLRTISRVIDELKPDVIHVHSSWAGLLVRILRLDTTRVVYTPHCYAFERLDISPAMRMAYRLVEKALARRTGMVVAVSPREAELACELRSAQDVRYVPNVARLPRVVPSQRSVDVPPTVIACGRLMAQKDPKWFGAFAGALSALRPDIAIRWLGGGSAEEEAGLRRQGVEVTGWISRDELVQELSQATVYVHSAAWEGAPLSVLEAAALGVPVFARSIASLESLDLPFLFETPEAAAQAVVSAIDGGLLEDVRSRMNDFRLRHELPVQREALVSAYRAVHRGPDRQPHTIDVRFAVRRAYRETASAEAPAVVRQSA